MQLFVLFVPFLFTASASVEGDMLSSVDIIVFDYSQRASRHWDCPRVNERAARAEEARIWQTVIPDARIKVVARRSRALPKAEQYKWVSSDPLMQGSVILGMRKPDLDGSTAPVKVLYSKSRQVNQNALSTMLPQLEQSKDRILEWMARTQVSITSMTPKTTGPLVDQRLRVPRATNYHPRVFRDAQFTTGDLVAWMALAAASRQKGHDAFKFFKLMAQSFLPGFSVSLGAVPTSSAGKPAKAIYLHRCFQYVPAGADLAFYFDGNRGRFLKTQNDSIVLTRPEGIVDGHAALLLSSDASSLEMHLTKTEAAMQKTFREEMERALAVHVPSEVQAIGVATIRSLAARLEQDSFLEAQRRVLEVKPALLTELLPAKLVRLVISYFGDDAYPFIVSAHRWSLKNEPKISVDGARLYVISESGGLKGISHSLSNLREGKRCCIELGDPQWSDHRMLTSSHDGRYVSFNHEYKTSTGRGGKTKRSTKWLMQGSELEGGKFRRVAFGGKAFSFGLLSRSGQTLFSCSIATNTTRAYQLVEKAEKSPTASLKFELRGALRAVSGNGNRVMVKRRDQLEVHDVGKGAASLACGVDVAGFIYFCALNEDGSEAAFANSDGTELRIVDVDKAARDKSAIVTVKVSESVGSICELVYSDENKLHVLHFGGSVSLVDPSTETLIPIEALQEGHEIIDLTISPNADYTATIQLVGKEEKSEKRIYKTIVRRKLGSAGQRDLFGCEAGEIADCRKQTKNS